MGFPGGSIVKCLDCGRSGFDPWVRKIPWRRKWHLLQYTKREGPLLSNFYYILQFISVQSLSRIRLFGTP